MLNCDWLIFGQPKVQFFLNIKLLFDSFSFFFSRGVFCSYTFDLYSLQTFVALSLDLTAAWLVQLGERQSAVREIECSSPRPDQHSGS